MDRCGKTLMVMIIAGAVSAWPGGGHAAGKATAKQEGAAEARAEATSQPAPASPKLDTEERRTFYALGASMGESLQHQFDPSPEEVEVFKAGLMDAMLKRTLQVQVDAYRPKFQQLVQARAAQLAEAEKKESEEFLKKMAKQKGAAKSDSGLIYIQEKRGKGARPKDTDAVKVHYHGTLRDGTVFDSSVDRGTPASFALNSVIPCWREGVQKMKVGGKAKLICPSSIAYGDKGRPPKIRPGATLVFNVELLDIVTGKPEELPPDHP